jgi:hypothetical protein
MDGYGHLAVLVNPPRQATFWFAAGTYDIA